MFGDSPMLLCGSVFYSFLFSKNIPLYEFTIIAYLSLLLDFCLMLERKPGPVTPSCLKAVVHLALRKDWWRLTAYTASVQSPSCSSQMAHSIPSTRCSEVALVMRYMNEGGKIHFSSGNTLLVGFFQLSYLFSHCSPITGYKVNLETLKYSEFGCFFRTVQNT